MRLTLIQTNLHWEDPAANRKMFSAKFDKLIGKTDLIIIPEMFSTGFSMRSKELAETMDGLTVSWLRESAKKVGAVITGSMIIQEGENFFNRLLWANPNGEISHYDKKHLPFFLIVYFQQTLDIILPFLLHEKKSNYLEK